MSMSNTNKRDKQTRPIAIIDSGVSEWFYSGTLL